MATEPGPGHLFPGSASCARILLPPSFVVRPIARVTGNPVQAAPPSWTCPRKILRELQEQSPLPPLLPPVCLHFLGQPATCRALGRPRPPLLRCARTPLPRPDSLPPARKAAQPPATPQVTRAFRSARPAEASSPGSPRAAGGTTASQGRGRAAPRGRPCQATAGPGSRWGSRGPARRDSGAGARASPRCARGSRRSSPPSGELRGVRGGVCVASPSPPSRPDRSCWPLRRLVFPCRGSRRQHATPAVLTHASRAALQPASPRRGTPSHRPRLAPSTKGSTSQPRRHLGLAPVSLSTWVDCLWTRAGEKGVFGSVFARF